MGYLAALGAASRTGATVRFTRSAQPVAVLGFDDGVDPASTVADSLVSVEELDSSVIARKGGDTVSELPRKPTLSQYRDRARLARAKSDRTLGSTVTDLTADVSELAHA
ncbi:MAG: hypothetical protein KDB24_17310, partial [Microthrixaceae bacterium]|nr:hypothetical protein [Microthrixaceae bacterium]